MSQADINYYLKQPAEKVVIDILDAKGQVVKTFTGIADDDKKRGAAGGGAGEPDEEEFFGPPRARPVPRKEGFNRFSWDLRYPGATGFKGMVLWGARADTGPLAVPGPYQVRLTVSGQTLGQSFNVEKDPRLDSLTLADLTEQFKLAMQVRDKTTEVNEMVIEIRELKKQMQDRLKVNQDPALKTALDAFGEKIGAVEEELYQVRNRSNQDPLNFPIKLNNRLAALDRSIQTGDGRPTEGAYKVFTELSKELDAHKARLDAVLKTALPELNRMLVDRKLKELSPTKTETKDETPAATVGSPEDD